MAKARCFFLPPTAKRPGGPERLLFEEDYFSLMLFGFLNPVVDTMRGLCSVSKLHLIAQSPEGGAIQIYCVLIVALPLQLYTGKRPSKRAMEMMQMYRMGFADSEELLAHLHLEKSAK